jgi:hypothetical protein
MCDGACKVLTTFRVASSIALNSKELYTSHFSVRIAGVSFPPLSLRYISVITPYHPITDNSYLFVQINHAHTRRRSASVT